MAGAAKHGVGGKEIGQRHQKYGGKGTVLVLLRANTRPPVLYSLMFRASPWVQCCAAMWGSVGAWGGAHYANTARTMQCVHLLLFVDGR